MNAFRVVHRRLKANEPDSIDRALCELAPEELAGCRRSQDWSDLLSAVLFISQECELDEVLLCRAAFFGTETPAAGAKALLDCVWDQAVVLPDVGPDEDE